ncbi:hypothetical protein HZH68_005278 [Vespula germanica]|uniref:Uncharacterized protein n=2 Tax=Vespula TaxID=7451 RepID=A0A834KDD7_VESGE|nr:hypothetical protein HZH68_005278 [Vespula germanica]
MLDDCLAENAGTQPSDVPLARRRDALARLTLAEGYIRAHNFIDALFSGSFVSAEEEGDDFEMARALVKRSPTIKVCINLSASFKACCDEKTDAYEDRYSGMPPIMVVDEENYDWGLSFCETIPIGSLEKTTVYKRDKPAPDDVKFFIEFYTMTL